MPAPLTLKFYSPDDEVLKTYVRNGMPAGVMRKAMQLFGAMDGKDAATIQNTDELMDSLAALIVELYGDQFTMDELYKHSYFDEWFTLIQQMMSRAQGVQAQYSPTSPRLNKKNHSKTAKQSGLTAGG